MIKGVTLLIKQTPFAYLWRLGGVFETYTASDRRQFFTHFLFSVLHLISCHKSAKLRFVHICSFMDTHHAGSAHPPPRLTDLADGQVVSLGADHLHLDTIHQPLQLVPDVPGSPHGAELDEVLVAPLCGVTALHPLRETDIMVVVSTMLWLWVGTSQGY